jgi:hypothetical protein
MVVSTMHRTVTGLVIVVAAGALAVGAGATAPKKGATYEGMVPEKLQFAGHTVTAGHHKITFTVSGDGKLVKTYKAFFTTNGCQLPPSGADTFTRARSIPIKHGSFAAKGSYTVNGRTDYVKLSGTFSNRGKSAAVIFHWHTKDPDCSGFRVTLKGTIKVK